MNIIEQAVKYATAEWRARNGLPPLNDSSPADLHEALLIEQDCGNVSPQRQDKAGGDHPKEGA